MKYTVRTKVIGLATIGAISLVPQISIIELESDQPQIVSNYLGDNPDKAILPPLVVHDATATFPII